MSERDSKKLRNEERNNVTIVHTETNVKSKTDAKEREKMRKKEIKKETRKGRGEKLYKF